MTAAELAELHAKAAANTLEYADHAVTRMAQRGITITELRAALSTGQVIEDYPNDRYGPGCLIFGTSAAGRALHVVCSYPQRPLLKIITVYEPTLQQWEPGFTERKKP